MGDLETEIETGREEGADENESPKNSEPKGKDLEIWLVKNMILKIRIRFVNLRLSKKIKFWNWVMHNDTIISNDSLPIYVT